MGGGGEAAAPHFLRICYGPSVACTVGCTRLTYSLCMAHIWPMYDLHMAHIAFRSAISSAIGSARRTDHEGTLAEKSVICFRIALYNMLGQYIHFSCQNDYSQNTIENLRALFWGALITYGIEKIIFKRA